MTTETEARGLARIRFRRTAFTFNIALLALACIGLHFFPRVQLPRTELLLTWCAAYAVTTLLCVFSRCPRCRHLFHSVYPTHNPASRSCRGCGLTLG